MRRTLTAHPRAPLALLLVLALALSATPACGGDEGGGARAGGEGDVAGDGDSGGAAADVTPELPGEVAGDTGGDGDAGADAPATPGAWDLPSNRIDDVELLLIVVDELAEAFAPLVDWRWARGIPTRLLTLSEVEADYQGADAPARIRAAIAAHADGHGARWVLLGGDHPMLPRREVHAEAYNPAEDADLNEDIATELYYADLDGDWDGDGDGAYGEPEDDVDLIPDVAVGRVPARTPEEAARYVAKLLAYEQAASPDYFDSAALIGEYAGSVSGMDICSTVALEGSIAKLIPEHVRVTRLYAEECGEVEGALPDTLANEISALNVGHNLVVNYGHGWWDALGELNNGDIKALTNEARPAIYVTTECNGCEFDVASVDHAACEAFVIAKGGGVAYLGNTDFGVGYPWLMIAYADWVERFYAQPGAAIGDLVTGALTELASEDELNEPLSDLRWTFLTWALMGDPALRVRTDLPRTPTIEVDQRASGSDEQVLEVTATVDGVPLEGATVSLWRDGVFSFRKETDPNGSARFFFPAASALSPCQITLTGPNLEPVTTSL
jgi:hypothetical protein